ncbi:MAG: polysaccharide biosynthesis/export family protein [Acidobacteriota bacterium]
MKKAIVLGIFSWLALFPCHSALAQTGSTPAVRSGVIGTAADRKLTDPAAEAGRNATAKNQGSPPATGESTDAISNVSRPEEAERNYQAGFAFYGAGKLDEAIGAFKESEKLKPNDARTQYMLGMAYWNSKAYSDAVDCFKRAVRFKPDWDEAYFRLGLTSYVLGRSTQTNDAYKKLLELNSPLALRLYEINNDANLHVNATPRISSKKATDTVPTSAANVTPRNRPPTVPVDNSHAPAATGLSEKAKPLGAAMAISPDEKRSPTSTTPIVIRDTATSNSLPVKGTATSATASSGETGALPDSPLTDIYKIGVGDVLDIRLLNSSSNRSTLYTVIDGGIIDFPVTGGPIAVTGLTTKEIQARITSELKRLAMDGRTQVSVGVREYASHTVIVAGLVSSPGARILRREAVPLYVLLAEVQPHPDAARAAVMRLGAPIRVLDLSDSTSLNFLVRPSDVINLTSRPQDFYFIGGHINYPGQKPFQPGITLMQAILAAGGFARNNEVDLSREGSEGRLLTTKIDLKEIKSGKIQDPKLQPGDRIEILH